jgi:hypothetical protein
MKVLFVCVVVVGLIGGYFLIDQFMTGDGSRPEATGSISPQQSAFDVAWNTLVETPAFATGLAVDDERIERVIERRIPNGGFQSVNLDIYGIAGDLQEPRGRRFIAVDVRMDRVYVSRTRRLKDFIVVDGTDILPWQSDRDACFEVYENSMLPGIPGHFLEKIESDRIILRRANLYDNIILCETLLEMYETIGDEKYLRYGEDMMRKIVQSFIMTDGTVRLEWMIFERRLPYYRAMPQAILMHTLSRWLVHEPKLDEPDMLQEAFETLCLTYVHTTEGCNNHFTNAVIGARVADSFLNVQTFVPGRMQDDYAGLVNGIAEQGGRISYVMVRQADYPSYIDSYQIYDFWLLGKLEYFFGPWPSSERLKSLLPELIHTTEEIAGLDADVLDFSATNLRSAYFMADGLRNFGMAQDPEMRGFLRKYEALVENMTRQQIKERAASPRSLIYVMGLLSGYLAE